MKVAVITDSNSGILQNEADELGIFLMPMPFMIDDVTYLEGVDMTADEYYSRMVAGADVKTSQPAPGSIMDMWDDVLGRGYDEIVYIPMSSGLSASCQSAKLLAEGDDYEGRVFVVDDHRISVTMRASVMDARYLASKGHSAADIKKMLEENAYNSSIYITVDTLEYLKKGGRCTASTAALATVLNIKPILTIQGEKLDTYQKVRGMKKAKDTMLEIALKERADRFKDVDDEHLCIGTAGTMLDQAEVDEWVNRVREAFPDAKEVYYNPLSFSIGCHIGPNSAAIAITGLLRDE